MSAHKIIDCHTHCYPAEVVEDPRSWAMDQGEVHWADLVAPKSRRSIQGWATSNEMLDAMDAANVERAVLLGWYWTRTANCRWHNEIIADWVHRSPDRFIGFAAIHPGDSAEAVIRQLEYARDLGLSGVGELHTGVQEFNHTSTGWQALADWCSEHNWPVNLHVTEAAGHHHAGNVPTLLNDLIRMAENAPQLIMILAHWGGGLPFFEQNPRLKKALKNVYYDTAASPLLYEPGIFRRVIDCVGSKKVLFGSDYPLRIYPGKQSVPDFTLFLESLHTEGLLSESELEDVLYGNARRILANKP